MELAPSLLSADFSNLSKDIQELEDLGIQLLHIDMMDGMFVPNISFGPLVMEWIRPLTDMIFDCHLMIQEPERYVGQVAKAGADIISVHVEATRHIHRAIQLIKSCGKKAGVVLNPGTPIEAVLSVLEEVDLVLVMSVNPGFGGQKFIPSAVSKIEKLNRLRDEMGYDYKIEVDGGINEETAGLALAAGADILVAGSYIFKNKDRGQAVQTLKNAGKNLNSQGAGNE